LCTREELHSLMCCDKGAEEEEDTWAITDECYDSGISYYPERTSKQEQIVGVVIATDIYDCQAKCQAEGNCHGFSFRGGSLQEGEDKIGDDYWYYQKNTCVLLHKLDDEQRKANIGWTSGKKEGCWGRRDEGFIAAV